ncbi:MAG: hypothetical protein EOO38_25175, partial [Cytophagaceae bacterium]
MDPLGNFRPDALRPLDIKALSYIYGSVETKKAMPVQWAQLSGGGLVSSGSSGNDTIVGIADRDLIRPHGGRNDVSSGDGDDVIDVSEGINLVRAGRGTDTLIMGVKYSDAPTLSYRTNTMQTDDAGGFEGQFGSTIFTGVEKLRFVDGTFNLSTGVFTASVTHAAVSEVFRILLSRTPTTEEIKLYGEAIDFDGGSVNYISQSILSGSEWLASVQNLNGSQIATRLYGRIFDGNFPDVNVDQLTTDSEGGLAAITNLVQRAVKEKGFIPASDPVVAISTTTAAHSVDTNDVAEVKIHAHHGYSNGDVGSVMTVLNNGPDRNADTVVVARNLLFSDTRLSLSSVATPGHGASGVIDLQTGTVEFKNLEAIVLPTG